MIDPNPLWRTRLSIDGEQSWVWSDGVTLTEDLVASTWFCLDRATGQQRWFFPGRFPHTAAFAVQNGVLVAHRWGGDMGPEPENLYLVRLADGVYLPEPRHWWERYFGIGGPGCAPVAVREGEVRNYSGDVISLVTGRKLRTALPGEFVTPPPSLERLSLYRKGVLLPCGRVFHNGTPGVWGDQRLWTEGEDAWEFNALALEWEIDSWRLAYPFLFLALHRRGQPLPLEHWLYTLDVRDGRIVQRIALADAPVQRGTVHAVDATGLVASVVRQVPGEKKGTPGREGEILYFARRTVEPSAEEQ